MQPMLSEVGIEYVQYQSRLNSDPSLVDVQLENFIHVFCKIDNHSRADTLTVQTCAAATRQNIHLIVGGSSDGGDDIGFIGGIRGLEELVRLVDSGEYQVAFAMYPVSVTELMNIADSGRVMPPKSTWFEPKLRSGLLVHTLD